MRALSTLRAIIVEEHHDAYYVWHYARTNGWAFHEPVTLLHVDQFSDLGVPPNIGERLDSNKLSEVAAYTYSELGVNTYLRPALADGFFDGVIWVRPTSAAGHTGRSAIRIGDQSICCDMITAAGTIPNDVKQVAISIDMAYFCHDVPVTAPPRAIEITRHAYQEFIGNRYHFLRLALHCQITPYESDGRFFLSFDKTQSNTCAKRAGHLELLNRRIEELSNFINKIDADCRLLVFSRSRRSAHGDSETADFVEKKLIRALSGRFAIESYSIDTLLESHLMPDREMVYA